MPKQLTLFSSPQTENGNDDWYTPKFIFDALALKFDIDVAAPPNGIPWIPAKRHFSMADDGLSQQWDGLVWCNPPFSKLTPWVDRFIEHGNGVLLTPFGRSKWLDRIWNSNALLLNLPTTMRWNKPDGTDVPMKFGVVLWAMGDTAQTALTNLGKTR